MNATEMMVGEYRNINCTVDLADVCDNVSRLVKHYRADVFMDFAGMRDIHIPRASLRAESGRFAQLARGIWMSRNTTRL